MQVLHCCFHSFVGHTWHTSTCGNGYLGSYSRWLRYCGVLVSCAKTSVHVEPGVKPLTTGFIHATPRPMIKATPCSSFTSSCWAPSLIHTAIIIRVRDRCTHTLTHMHRWPHRWLNTHALGHHMRASTQAHTHTHTNQSACQRQGMTAP